MIISSLLNRENLSINDKIKILWTDSNEAFTKFIEEKTKCQLMTFNQLYYGDDVPNLIICNDKVQYKDQCYAISINLHLPVLLIDHNIKNPLYDDDKIHTLNLFPCVYHVAISKTVSESWKLKNVQVLSYNLNDEENIEIWKNLIVQTTKTIFKI